MMNVARAFQGRRGSGPERPALQLMPTHTLPPRVVPLLYFGVAHVSLILACLLVVAGLACAASDDCCRCSSGIAAWRPLIFTVR